MKKVYAVGIASLFFVWLTSAADQAQPQSRPSTPVAQIDQRTPEQKLADYQIWFLIQKALAKAEAVDRRMLPDNGNDENRPVLAAMRYLNLNQQDELEDEACEQ